MPRRTFFKLFGQIGQDATALSNSIAWMTYRRFSSTRRFTRYGVTYTEDSGDKSPIIKSSSEEYMNWQDEFQKRCGIRPMELRSLYTDPENIKPIEGLNESQVMPKYEGDEKTPVYLKNDKGEFMLDKNGKKIPDTVEYFFSLPQQQPVGKAGGLVKTAFDTAPKCVLAKNFEIASDYAKELKGQPGRVSIAYQFYKGRLYNFNLKQLEILYPELKPTSKELDENNEPTDAYWDRAVEKLKSIYGEDCAERSKNSIKISGVVNGHISLIIDVVCKNGLRKMVASELCKPQYLYLNDDFVKPNYNDLEVPSIIYPMHKDSTTGTVGVPQDIQDWDAEYVTDRYKSDTPSLTMGKPDLLKGSVNTNGYTVMLVSHETPRAGDLAQLTLMMTGEDLFNALLTNPFYSLP
ncbi:MAG: hypothetical protein CMN56_05480, partial [Sneathiella sp.]|uniref:hypothetical protein n=1 Tax=Sneathiella sp. TaxID=1964365 RepID=UPI000C3A165B